ncbi:hypothetical protein MRB53_014663 [Persea americana]|uniref:Uncharacterized protein n=1 Tax=Persea americana TaxID=3435 RepID=A0ACC2KBH8_PERAE|nr:hypothetical protein MRB53_014663 [Persea americana]
MGESCALYNDERELVLLMASMSLAGIQRAFCRSLSPLVHFVHPSCTLREEHILGADGIGGMKCQYGIG